MFRFSNFYGFQKPFAVVNICISNELHAVAVGIVGAESFMYVWAGAFKEGRDLLAYMLPMSKYGLQDMCHLRT